MEMHELFKQIAHPKDVDDYYHCYNSSNVLNSVYWWKFFELIRYVDGDIVECGVGRGRSLITLLSINKYFECLSSNYKRKVFALDSFEGFPQPHKNDYSLRSPKQGEWSHSPNKQFRYSAESLMKVLELSGAGDLNDESFEIVEGFFNKTTIDLGVKKICILHLDGDLYESVLTPLTNLWSNVSIGGLIVIDDYIADERYSVNEAFPGARKAVEEFLSSNNYFELKISIRGTPYLVRTR